jgi:hypothetical protein
MCVDDQKAIEGTTSVLEVETNRFYVLVHTAENDLPIEAEKQILEQEEKVLSLQQLALHELIMFRVHSCKPDQTALLNEMGENIRKSEWAINGMKQEIARRTAPPSLLRKF